MIASITLKQSLIKSCDYIIEYGLLAIVFFIPLVFDYSFSSYNFFDLYKAIIFRVILTLALLAFTAKIFISGRLNYRGSFKIFLLAGFLLISFFISSLYSLRPAESFWGSFLRQQGFYNFFNYWLFFALLALNLETFKQVRRLIIAVMASAFLAAAYGLIQYFQLDPFIWSEGAGGRIFSSLGQPNFFGHWLVMVLPLSLYGLIFMAKKMLARFFVSLILLLQLACLVFTYSRAAWLGFLGSMFFLIIFWLFYKRFKKIAFGFIGLILIGVIAVAGLNITGRTKLADYNSISLANRLKSIVDFKGGSNKMRLYYLESSVQEIKQASYLRLLTGYGPETLADIFIKYYRIDWGAHETINSLPDRAHNWLFDQILALGFLGLAANLIFYAYFIYQAAVSLRPRLIFSAEHWLLVFLFSSLAAYSVNNLFSFSLLTNFVYLHLILALAWVMINYNKEIRTINIRLTLFSKILILGALFIVSGVFIYINNINQARAEIHYVKALGSFRAGNCRGVRNSLEKAMSLSPRSSYYRENYLFLMLNCFSRAEDKPFKQQLIIDLLKQIKLIGHKKSYGMLHNLARVYTLFGSHLDKSYYVQAEEIFNDLIMDFPYFTAVYQDYGDQKIAQKDYARAAEIYNQGLKILPPLDQPYLNDEHRRQIIPIAVKFYESAGQAYFKLKNYDLALGFYNKGLKLDPFRATLYKNIADVYYVQNKLDQAVKYNKRGLALNPADYHWPLTLSLLYRDKKDLPEARKYLAQALILAPENDELKEYDQELNK